MTKHWSSDNDRKPSPRTANQTSEGSALFSLKELKAKAEAAARASKPQARDENSGLIDLKGMMAQAEQENAREADSSLHVTSHLAVYPFGAPTEAAQAVVPQAEPVAAVTEEEDPRRWRRPRRGRAGGIGVATALLGIAAVAVAAVSLGLGAFEAPRTALATPIPTALQWAMTPALTAPVATENAEVAGAERSQTEKEKATDVATPRPPKEIPHIAKAPVLNRTAEAPVKTPKPPVTATKPASDPCNGDLMCAMQRAVKK